MHRTNETGDRLWRTISLTNSTRSQLAASRGVPLWAARAPYQPQDDFDLMLVPRVKGWQEDADALAALERIEAEPWIESIDRERQAGAGAPRRATGSRRTGAALTAGEAPSHTDLAAGRRFALNFWDANSTKALHIGHLRNLALGNALGCGADRGRRQGRAAQHHLRRRPQHGRGDGRRRARAAATPSPRPRAARRATTSSATATPTTSRPGPSLTGRDDNPADSLTREVDVHHDSADELLQRVLDGDQDGDRALVEDARLGDLRPAQDPGPARHLLRPRLLRVRLPARGRRALRPRAASTGCCSAAPTAR